MNDPDLKALWQSSDEDGELTMSVDEVRSRAERFEAKIKRRNVLEWLASAFVIYFFGTDALEAETTGLLVGNLIMVAAAIGISVYLWRRGQVQLAFDPTQDTRTFVVAHATALEDQARLLSRVPIWYLSPFAVGLMVLMASRFPTGDRSLTPWWGTVAIIMVVYAGIWWLNYRGAHTLRSQAASLLEELD